LNYSEQQVVDCTYAASYDGCNGGDHHDAWNYLFKSGQQPSSTYAYTSGTTGKDTTCKYSSSKVFAKLNNTGTDLPQNETAIQAALVANGPITTAYYVSNNFFSYK
jgi:Papain family cysteine protease